MLKKKKKKKKKERSLQSTKFLPILYKSRYTSIEIVVVDPTAILRKKKSSKNLNSEKLLA